MIESRKQGPPFEKGSTASRELISLAKSRVGAENPCLGATDAVSGAHQVLSAMGARGRIWDPSKSKEENHALEYSPEAYDWFLKNNLPVPPECHQQHEASGEDFIQFLYDFYMISGPCGESEAYSLFSLATRLPRRLPRRGRRRLSASLPRAPAGSRTRTSRPALALKGRGRWRRGHRWRTTGRAVSKLRTKRTRRRMKMRTSSSKIPRRSSRGDFSVVALAGVATTAWA